MSNDSSQEKSAPFVPITFPRISFILGASSSTICAPSDDLLCWHFVNDNLTILLRPALICAITSQSNSKANASVIKACIVRKVCHLYYITALYSFANIALFLSPYWATSLYFNYGRPKPFFPLLNNIILLPYEPSVEPKDPRQSKLKSDRRRAQHKSTLWQDVFESNCKCCIPFLSGCCISCTTCHARYRVWCMLSKWVHTVSVAICTTGRKNQCSSGQTRYTIRCSWLQIVSTEYPTLIYLYNMVKVPHQKFFD